MRSEKNYIYGKHAVVEAVTNAPHIVRKVFMSADFSDEEIRRAVLKSGASISLLKPGEASRAMGENTVHQGIFAQVALDSLLIPFDRFMKNLDYSKDHCLVLLDELNDPHNVGAIIRSAAAFGASAVLIPDNNQAPVTGTVVKTSAGMAFRVPLVSISNVNNAIKDLKDNAFSIYGLAMAGSKEVGREEFKNSSVIVIGNEDRGLKKRTMELCDGIVRIPMHARCESLNAAVSAAIVLYEWSTKHKESLK